MSARFPYSPAKRLPVPAVILDLSDPSGTVTIPAVSAHLDTGADQTVVPLALIRRLGVQPVGRAVAKGYGGLTAIVDVFEVSLLIPNLGIYPIQVLGHSAEPYVLVGRDILNLFRITFDGPNQVTEFH
jgi:hypothetical protein